MDNKEILEDITKQGNRLMQRKAQELATMMQANGLSQILIIATSYTNKFVYTNMTSDQVFKESLKITGWMKNKPKNHTTKK